MCAWLGGGIRYSVLFVWTGAGSFRQKDIRALYLRRKGWRGERLENLRELLTMRW